MERSVLSLVVGGLVLITITAVLTSAITTSMMSAELSTEVVDVNTVNYSMIDINTVLKDEELSDSEKLLKISEIADNTLSEVQDNINEQKEYYLNTEDVIN